MIGELVAKLIAAGTPPEVAASVVAEAFAAGVSSAPVRVTSADESVTRRREKDRIRQQNRRDNLRISADLRDDPQMSQNASISKDLKKESKRQNSSRGTRIPSDWSLTDAERSFAKGEGFSDWEIQRELQKFRDYWTACAGSKGVKLDWAATWRQWIRNSSDRAGKKPAPTESETAAVVSGYYAKAESEQLAAWDAYHKRTTGKLLPRDRNFGWRVPSEWPPDMDAKPALQVASQ